jgi:YD repeat-containing protein
LSRTDPDGGTLTNIYNSSGEISSQTDPSGVSYGFTYSEVAGVPAGDGPGDATTVTVTPGTGLPPHVTQYNFDFGVLTSTIVNPGMSASTTQTTRSPITIQTTSSTDPDVNTSTTTLSNPSSPGAYLNAVDPT